MTRRKLVIITFWIGLWQILSIVSKDKIFFVGPVDVIESLAGQLVKADFWISIASSIGKIGAGFITGFLLGIVIGVLAYRFLLISELLSPIMSVIKSVPVASFVILALIWMGSKNLSIFIAFLVVLPIIYTSTISALNSTDKKLLEMAEVFNMKRRYKAMAIYKPALMPYLISSCKVALGMAWKSGIAAEVIGVPDLSIGERLYTSKIYLDTAGLFAWTLVIVLLSVLTEKLFLVLLRVIDKAYPLDMISFSDERNVGTGLCASPGECRKSSLSIISINKSYGEQRVLEGYSLSLSSDGVYCLMGPSGRGKTTLLNILSGIVKPDGGDISDFYGLTVTEVFQEDRLQEALSPIRNVQIAIRSRKSKEEIKKELSFILSEDCLDKPVRELSGGMKRRTAICRAVMPDSNIIIMDEPFTGLDKESKLRTIEYIKKNRRGRLLIISTHNEEDIELLEAQRLQLH